MSTVCGICESEPSKYKCPTCTLPYCSLACYKPHKTSHADEPKPNPPEVIQEEEVPTDVKPPKSQGYSSWPPDFANLVTNPEFETLLKQYPGLKDQLRDVFLQTFEPSAEDQRSSSYNRGYGRGRGSGFRGNYRGRGGSHGRWTKEKGDKAATSLMQRIERGEDENSESLKAFVDLVSRLYEKEKTSFAR